MMGELGADVLGARAASGAGPEASAMLICIAQGWNVMAKVRPARDQLEGVVQAALDGIRRSPEPKATTLE